MSVIFKVDKVINGYVITAQYDETEETIVGLDDCEGRVTDFMRFLQEINGQFGPESGRYSEERIRVIKLPGDKYGGVIDTQYKAYLQDLLIDVAYSLGLEDSINTLKTMKAEEYL